MQSLKTKIHDIYVMHSVHETYTHSCIYIHRYRAAQVLTQGYCYTQHKTSWKKESIHIFYSSRLAHILAFNIRVKSEGAVCIIC